MKMKNLLKNSNRLEERTLFEKREKLEKTIKSMIERIKNKKNYSNNVKGKLILKKPGKLFFYILPYILRGMWNCIT